MTSQIESRIRRTAGYKIRQLTEADIPRADDLWTLAFGSGWVRNYAHKFNHRNYGAFEGNELHAVTSVIDYKMSFGDKLADCGGIAAVATAPGQRYQNLVGMLLHQVLRELHEADYAFASLYPFSYPFYEKMGWAATNWQYDISVSSEWVKNAAKRGNAKAFRMASPKEYDASIAVYERWYKHFNFGLSRSESKFRAAMEYPGRDYRLFIHDDGFIIMDLEKSDRNAGILRIPEFAYLNDQAYLDGLAFLGQMDAQFETLNWIDWDVDKLLSSGVPYPKPEIKRQPAMMTRVVNDKAFYKLLPKQPKIKLSDPLEVTWSNEGGIGVGEILQVVTGFFSKPGTLYPELHNMVGGWPAFCLERY